MLNGKAPQSKGQGASQKGKGYHNPKTWKCAGVAGCGHAWNLPSSTACRSCGLHWDFNLRPSLKGQGGGAAIGKSGPAGAQPVGAAPVRAPWVKHQGAGTKGGSGVTGCDGTDPAALEKACGILADLLGEEHPEVRTRREHISAISAGNPPSRAKLIKTCDELAAILGEEHLEVVARRKVILETPGDSNDSVPAQKQLQNILRQLDGLHKKHITQSARVANLEEQQAKLQAEIETSKGFVLATQGRIDDAENLKSSILAKCSKNEGIMEVDGGGEADSSPVFDFEVILNGDDDLDPDHLDMFNKFVHLKDTLANLAKAKLAKNSSRVGDHAGELPQAVCGLPDVAAPPTKFGMSMSSVDTGNSKAWPTLCVKTPTSGSSYGKSPAITHQRGMPFSGLQV